MGCNHGEEKVFYQWGVDEGCSEPGLQAAV